MASLTASLIARKGNARPSVPSSGFGKSLLPHDNTNKASQKPALHLCDVGLQGEFDPQPAPKKTNEKRIAEPVKLKEVWGKKRVQKTLRLDPELNSKLLAIGEEQNLSQQALMHKAVARYLKSLVTEQSQAAS